MQPSGEDILGKQNPDRRIGVILAHTKKPDGLAVIDLLHELGLKSKDRSGLNDNHLKKLVKAGVLEECQAIPERGEQKKKRQRDAHRLNQDLDTFAKLLNTFIGTDDQDTFLYSQYCLRKLPDPRDPAPVHGKEITVPLFSINLCDLAKHPNPPGLKVASPPIAMSGVHKTIEEIIVEHAVRLHSILRRFYPELQLYTVLDAFLTELHPVAVERDHIPFDRPDP
jgi:hypothetical protein